MIVYVDTNILMDYATNRDRRGEKFLFETFNCKHSLVISDLTIYELEKNKVFLNSLFMMLTSLRKLTFIVCSQKQKEDAKQYATFHNTHFADALHIIVSLDAGSECLLTQNIRDFMHCPIAKTYAQIGIK